MCGWNALTNDSSGDRNELVINIVDTGFLYFLPDLLDEVVSSWLVNMGFKLGHFYSSPYLVFELRLRSVWFLARYSSLHRFRIFFCRILINSKETGC